MSNKQYIEVDAVKKAFVENVCNRACELGGCESPCEEFAVIDCVPKVDVVEVVRCKDCKHWKEITNGNWEHEPYCECAGWLIGGNGYCVYGERKE